MIDLVKADSRHFSEFSWVRTYRLFSFSSYFDPHNIQFSALRVFKNDVVQPGKGFPAHLHEEMEIITVVLDRADVTSVRPEQRVPKRFERMGLAGAGAP